MDAPLVVDSARPPRPRIAAAARLVEELRGEEERLADAEREVRHAEAGENLAVWETAPAGSSAGRGPPAPARRACPQLPEGVALTGVDRLGRVSGQQSAQRRRSRRRHPPRRQGDATADHRADASRRKSSTTSRNETSATAARADDQAGLFAPNRNGTLLVEGGELGPVGLRVAAQEVEDAVPPRDRGRWRTSTTRPASATGWSASAAGRCPGRAASPGSAACPRPSTAAVAGVGAVEAEDDDLRMGRLRSRCGNGKKKRNCGKQDEDAPGERSRHIVGLRCWTSFQAPICRHHRTQTRFGSGAIPTCIAAASADFSAARLLSGCLSQPVSPSSPGWTIAANGRDGTSLVRSPRIRRCTRPER